MEATEHFVKNFTTVKYDQLSPEVVETTKKQVLDFFGVALAGSAKEGATTELYAETGCKSTVISGVTSASRQRRPSRATMAHALIMTMCEAIIHPGVITV